MRIVLWDIDGTLLLTGGAGVRAFARTLAELSFPEGMEGVDPGGKTDPQIVREVLARRGAEHRFDELLPVFLSRYLVFFEEELAATTGFRVLPGAHELVSTLSSEEGVLQGLATGNLEEAAYMKLERAGLRSFFSCGGYGSDAENRTEVVRVAIERARSRIASGGALSPAALGVGPQGNDDDLVFVIGDTPLDVLHGKAAGARTIAVASGSYSAEALEPHGPDLLVESLEPLDPILAYLLA